MSRDHKKLIHSDQINYANLTYFSWFSWSALNSGGILNSKWSKVHPFYASITHPLPRTFISKFRMPSSTVTFTPAQFQKFSVGLIWNCLTRKDKYINDQRPLALQLWPSVSRISNGLIPSCIALSAATSRLVFILHWLQYSTEGCSLRVHYVTVVCDITLWRVLLNWIDFQHGWHSESFLNCQTSVSLIIRVQESVLENTRSVYTSLWRWSTAYIV